MEIAQQDNIQAKLIEIRGQKVLIDSNIAELYRVETKRINEAVKLRNFLLATCLRSVKRNGMR